MENRLDKSIRTSLRKALNVANWTGATLQVALVHLHHVQNLVKLIVLDAVAYGFNLLVHVIIYQHHVKISELKVVVKHVDAHGKFRRQLLKNP